MQFIAVSGSLRRASTNTGLLQTVQQVAPGDLRVTVFAGIGDLPHFHPDRADEPIAALAAWRSAVRDADAVIFSTPEYAHGLPGVLKNALDWLVGGGEMEHKPFALFNTTARGTGAQASLIEVARTMAGRHIESADVTLPLQRSSGDDLFVLTPEQEETVRAALETLRRAVVAERIL